MRRLLRRLQVTSQKSLYRSLHWFVDPPYPCWYLSQKYILVPALRNHHLNEQIHDEKSVYYSSERDFDLLLLQKTGSSKLLYFHGNALLLYHMHEQLPARMNNYPNTRDHSKRTVPTTFFPLYWICAFHFPEREYTPLYPLVYIWLEETLPPFLVLKNLIEEHFNESILTFFCTLWKLDDDSWVLQRSRICCCPFAIILN